MTDTDVANTKLAMPPMEDLAVETIQRLIAKPYTSSVMKLSRPVLNELGRRLLEPGVETSRVIEWVHTKKADLPERNIYRFAQYFRETFKLVWAGWADKLLITELSSDPDYQVDDLQRLIKNRVTTLVAQEVMTSSPEDLDTSRLNTVLSMVTAADKGQLEREKLLLLQGQAEHRAAKAEAETEKLRMDIEARKREHQRSIEDAKKTVQSKVESGSKAMDADDVIALLDKVMKGEA
ncbi:MAG: hypothetical protein AAGI37_06865 [Planctomycetota bacterium]